MSSRLAEFAWRLIQEPPLRLFARALLRRCDVSAQTRALWDLSKRPQYLLGVLQAARQALSQKVPEISALEFGVAGGSGLLVLQAEAAAVEAATGVRVKVYGFDLGSGGLPAFIEDHRDHPDVWKPGDFPMEEAALRGRLTDRTALVLGPVRDTVPAFFASLAPPPIGFVSIDLDLYSSTREALALFTRPDKSMLWHVPIYCDDVAEFRLHRFGGELLAISEFNQSEGPVKIDRWRGIAAGRPFPEAPFLGKFFVAHDLAAIAKCRLERGPDRLPL